MFGLEIPKDDVRAIKEARDKARAENPDRRLMCGSQLTGGGQREIFLTNPHEALWTEEGGLLAKKRRTGRAKDLPNPPNVVEKTLTAVKEPHDTTTEPVANGADDFDNMDRRALTAELVKRTQKGPRPGVTNEGIRKHLRELDA